MTQIKPLLLTGLLCLSPKFAAAAEPTPASKPNIIMILCVDLGYGDIHCLNPERGKIPTPRLDQFAGEGMTFTEAHASASVCSPSRYSILTGRYNWRSKMTNGIVPLWGEPLIARDRLTVPGLLTENGYATACIGKWHLGWDWDPKIRAEKTTGKQAKKSRDREATEEQKANWKNVFSRPLAEGPTARGFDYYFGTDVPNWPPYCFIENNKTIGIPSQFLPGTLLGGKLASAPGPAIEGWNLEAILPTITDKACEYISRRSKEAAPFFLYFALTSPHTPIAVTPEWKGKSGLGDYADYVMETDAMIGRVLDAVEKSGAAANTLIFLSSDNGCAPHPIQELEKQGHYPSEYRRGAKFDLWDGGHRIPLLVRWPGVVKPKTVCGQLVCLTDFMATCAEVVQAKLPDTAGEDSASLFGILKGKDAPVREALVNAAHCLAIREGKWKLQVSPGSGGNSQPTDAMAEKAGMPPVQLYDMSQDVGEQKNLQAEHPEVVERLKKRLEKIIADGRSTPGNPQKNDTPVTLEQMSKKSLRNPSEEEH